VSESGFFGTLSVLCDLIVQVQARKEAIAWVAPGNHIFFPPDFVFRGVEIEGLSVIRVPGDKAGLKATDWLVRSGAFGLIVVDSPGPVDDHVLGRLSRMAEEKNTAVVFLTRKQPEAPSLGTQVSLRGVVLRLESGETEWYVTRDKRSGPPSRKRVRFHGPSGLY